MMISLPTLGYLGAFVLIAVAARQLSRLVLKVNLPLITGMLITGILAGPFLFKMISPDGVERIKFVEDISLAFIAFAAGSELYLRELTRRFRSIAWNTFGQLVVTFLLSSVAIYFLADFLPFVADLPKATRAAVAIMGATIFVARSPSSAIAVINEMRAKGPFTSTALGVTVVKDVLVIILFAICISVSQTLVSGNDFELSFLGLLAAELVVSFGLGLLLGKAMEFVLSLKIHERSKSGILLLLGWGIFIGSHYIEGWSLAMYGHSFHLEPLLICILGSFYVTNYTRFRPDLHRVVEEVGPIIYTAFFTFIGISLSLEILVQVYAAALVFFLIRLIAMAAGAYVGATMAGDPPLFRRIGFMPYVTQAGVGLGLAADIASTFPGWGTQLATILISVIVLNQIVGPPLFKWSIRKAGEDHSRAAVPEFDGIRDAIIFGLEDQSIALARSLMKHGWEVKLATRKPEADWKDYADEIQMVQFDDINLELLERLDARKSEAMVMMLSDRENYRLSELAYEEIGTKDIIVRLNDRSWFEKFSKLEVRIVDPSTALVSLMDHIVRSPQATAMLLGQEVNQDTMDVEVLNPDLHGVYLRDLRLPADVLVLSVSRGGHSLISHGYTRLRKGDVVTLLGSFESLQRVSLRFDG